jgi:hypothetical protein
MYLCVIVLRPLLGFGIYNFTYPKKKLKFMKGFSEDAKVCCKTNKLFFFLFCDSSMLYKFIIEKHGLSHFT